MLHTDICIGGAGVIGLSLALELQARNLRVTVVEAGHPLREASWAAAGMLAAEDPHNPAELSALSALSVALYPEFLQRLQCLGADSVPFQTFHTLQSTHPAGSSRASSISIATTDSLLREPASATENIPAGFHMLNEHSIDPRQLAAALLAAAAATPIRLLTESPVVSTHSEVGAVRITTPTHTIEAAHFVDCTGAWANGPEYKVVPIKGQMLAVALPSSLAFKICVRTGEIYILPRTSGPMAGHAIIGATVEDAGFDRSIHASQIEDLRQQAIALIPELAHATVVDSWSGLRPATPDHLPILGAHPARRLHWIATGHYRNGILLAPATARVMAQMLIGEAPSVSMEAFSASRHSLSTAVPR